MLYIALIIALATATGLGLLAHKRDKDYNKILKQVTNLCDINRKLEVYLKFIKIEAEISEREIARLKNQIKSMQRADVKEGLILQSHADMARVERSVENV
jgi:cell fate (sporulation/competence/biofilm development) regulator YmcA (YheA/YmcA/DUF963 family)